MNKFLNTYKSNREQQRKRVDRFAKNTNLDFSVWYDILLYKEIEKRGYHVTVWHKQGIVEWEELEKYAISKVNKNREWTRK